MFDNCKIGDKIETSDGREGVIVSVTPKRFRAKFEYESPQSVFIGYTETMISSYFEDFRKTDGRNFQRRNRNFAKLVTTT